MTLTRDQCVWMIHWSLLQEPRKLREQWVDALGCGSPDSAGFPQAQGTRVPVPGRVSIFARSSSMVSVIPRLL